MSGTFSFLEYHLPSQTEGVIIVAYSGSRCGCSQNFDNVFWSERYGNRKTQTIVAFRHAHSEIFCFCFFFFYPKQNPKDFATLLKYVNLPIKT